MSMSLLISHFPNLISFCGAFSHFRVILSRRSIGCSPNNNWKTRLLRIWRMERMRFYKHDLEILIHRSGFLRFPGFQFSLMGRNRFTSCFNLPLWCSIRIKIELKQSNVKNEDFEAGQEIETKSNLWALSSPLVCHISLFQLTSLLYFTARFEWNASHFSEN